jgi:leucine dehydrogenase
MNVSIEFEGWADSKSRRMVDTIFDKTLEVFRISDEQNIPVNKAADVMAESRISSIKNIKNSYLGKINHRMPGQKRRF